MCWLLIGAIKNETVFLETVPATFAEFRVGADGVYEVLLPAAASGDALKILKRAQARRPQMVLVRAGEQTILFRMKDLFGEERLTVEPVSAGFADGWARVSGK